MADQNSTDPPSIPLDSLQGDWVALRGEAVRVTGTELTINGSPVGNGLKLTADGKNVNGFSVYKLDPGETSGDQVAWHAGPQQLIWRRAEVGEVESRIEMYGAANSRAAAAAADSQSDYEAVLRLNALIERWRVGPLMRVRSDEICPDWTNRAQTGLSVDHVHYVASMIAEEGFKSRRRGLDVKDGAHDVPVLIRESAESELGAGALGKWKAHVAANPDFPPFLLEGKKEFYCSLGNGHFSQALNLFRTASKCLYSPGCYDASSDAALLEALEDGVESVVLSSEMPELERRFVSEMLNKAHGRPWTVGDDGRVVIDNEVPTESSNMFTALSKVLDADELSCLVRQKLGVGVDRETGDASGRQQLQPVPVSRL
eukprot:TRINITY_DN17789_c0_g1_i2.p1 TRINITY_DN17789_c0_g1~~TRINITY_DN17789_c0_g1_i2.p1  ORF type:complete len:398 (+),score=86.73 TRINITY_DN17789_c0_g1_i2:80-1195(+)